MGFRITWLLGVGICELGLGVDSGVLCVVLVGFEIVILISFWVEYCGLLLVVLRLWMFGVSVVWVRDV